MSKHTDVLFWSKRFCYNLFWMITRYCVFKLSLNAVQTWLLVAPFCSHRNNLSLSYTHRYTDKGETRMYTNITHYSLWLSWIFTLQPFTILAGLGSMLQRSVVMYLIPPSGTDWGNKTQRKRDVIQYWITAGPPSATLGQRKFYIGWTYQIVAAVGWDSTTAYTKCWPNVGLRLVHRLRRWPDLKTELDWANVF